MDIPLGRGRGRGRGAGVPVLPSGLWDEMQGNDETRAMEDALEDKAADTSRFNDAGRGKVRSFEKDAKGTDWECGACSNVNWSWRASCNRCGHAKPIALLTTEEIRDGVGGGFNEYQERVSAANVEIAEDGFDDFGRRVKGNKSNKSAKELAALERLQKNYGFLMGAPPIIAPNEEVKPKYATTAKEREKYNAVAQPLPAPEAVVSKAALARESAKNEAKDKSSNKHPKKHSEDPRRAEKSRSQRDSEHRPSTHKDSRRRSRSREQNKREYRDNGRRDSRDRSRDRHRDRSRSRDRRR